MGKSIRAHRGGRRRPRTKVKGHGHANMNSRSRAVKRELLLKRDGSKCWLCKAPLRATDVGDFEVTIDHVHPLADGGNNDLGNLRLAHRRCNEERGIRLERGRQAAQSRNGQ